MGCCGDKGYHHAEEKCCHHEKEESCHSHAQSCHSEECDIPGWFLQVADSAWEEVLKEKIKEHILSTHGKRMTELAKIVSEANSMRWKHKMEKKKACSEFKEDLCHFFSSKK